jgi:hypothetical protein
VKIIMSRLGKLFDRGTRGFHFSSIVAWRATNDPWLWALHDHQVTNSMLVTDDEDDDVSASEGMEGLVADAKHNTELFTSVLR